ncbi:MAG TPA: DNA gyrase C-terminal beta-propeller domain-containing protein, partial [Lysobacter sp.]
ESDKDGMRIYIEVKRGESAEVVLNNLYQQTQMESVFGINMVAIVDGRPKLLNLKELLEVFVKHRREVVTRRTIFELRKARQRAHILEGLTVALANIDEMIELIRTSANPNEARERMLARTWEPGLVGALLAAAGSDASRPEDLPAGVGLIDGRYQLTETQAQQILEMRLHRLTGLEQDKLTDEYKQLLETIRGLIEILEDPNVLLEVIRTELRNVKEEFGDARRSEIRASEEDLDILDLIAPEDVVVTLSHAGYAKRQPVSAYRAQKRGGKGRNAAATKDEDFIDHLWLVNTHDTLLTFTSAGRVFWLPVHQLPDAGPNARGRPIINWIPLEAGEQVQAVLPVREYTENCFVFFATRNGTVKKTPLTEFAFRLQRGKIAINLDDGDALVDVAMTDGARDIMLFASNGKAVRFAEDAVRSMGRTATGVRGIRLAEGEEGEEGDEAGKDTGGAYVVSLIVVDGDGDILTASERGYGKRTALEEYPRKGRGGQGVIALKTTERNGKLIGAVQLSDHHDVLLISDGGTLVRTRAAEISQVGRNTQGVTLMRMAAEESLQTIERVDASLDEDEGDAEPAIEGVEGQAPEPSDSLPT